MDKDEKIKELEKRLISQNIRLEFQSSEILKLEETLERMKYEINRLNREKYQMNADARKYITDSKMEKSAMEAEIARLQLENSALKSKSTIGIKRPGTVRAVEDTRSKRPAASSLRGAAAAAPREAPIPPVFGESYESVSRKEEERKSIKPSTYDYDYDY
jgi:hypothetical protein